MAQSIEGLRRRKWSVGILYLSVALLSAGSGAPDLCAQQWRGRIATRWQFLDVRPIVLDSVAAEDATTEDGRFFAGDTLVTCAPGATHCFFYRPGEVETTAPLVSDLSLNVWGFGLEGLRAYATVRVRGGVGETKFWPRADDHFDLFAAYLELNRRRYRVRVGRDYQASGLGYYGYDGGSIIVRLPAKSEVEVYGGWGLARGVPSARSFAW